MKLGILTFLTTASIALGAVGDVLNVNTRPDGWTAEVTLEGMIQGGTYDFGLGDHNNPLTGTPKVVFTVTSMGFDDSGNPTTNVRSVYGTRFLRKASPNEAQADDYTGGGNVTVTIVLSDYIYEKDEAGIGKSGTDVICDIRSGFYTAASTSNNATGAGFQVTNDSLVAYQKVVADWAYPGFQLMGTTSKLRCVAYHRHGQSGRPVRAVKFTVSDTVHEATQFVTGMSYVPGMNDANPVIEYVSSSNLVNGMTPYAPISMNFKAYPWVGDSSSVFDTSTGGADPASVYGPKTGIADPDNDYKISMALVDPVAGNDTNGLTYDSTTYNAGTAVPYLTLGGAAKGIRSRNNTFNGHDDVAGGIVEMKDGTYSWLGSNPVGGFGSVPGVWITFRPAPGATRAGVIINDRAAIYDVSDRVRLQNITIASNTANTFSGCLALWLDNCILTSTNSGMWQSAGQRIFITGGEVDAFAQGLRSVSINNIIFPLIRGVDLSAFHGDVHLYTDIGNIRMTTATGGPKFIEAITGHLGPASQPIFAYNKLMGYDNDNTIQTLRLGTVAVSNTIGGAIVQNLVEAATGDISGNATIYASEGTTGNTPLDNLIYWHNTFVGGRSQFAYNSSGSTLKHRRYWSVKANYWDISGIKGDTFTGATGANGLRVGNWPVSFGVGASDNVNGNVASINAPGFDFDFFGLNSVDTATSNLESYPEFVDRKSYTGVDGLGQGDYHVEPTSPLTEGNMQWVLPYDLDGDVRDASNTGTGAYAMGAAIPNDFPVVSITSPADNSTLQNPITLTATATDTEDGNIAANITWDSTIDDAIGIGASISPTFSVGTHTITATIEDSNGAVDTDTITLIVSPPDATGNATATRINTPSLIVR
jgi:hypothetical protein